MFNAPLMLLVVVASVRSSPAQLQGKSGFVPPQTWERGGAIIDLTEPKRPSSRGSHGIEVRVLEVFDGNQVLLSIGTDQGVHKGQEGFLSTGWPERGSMPGFERVELTAVGMSYSIGRFKHPSFLGLALQRKENPVRQEALRWIPMREFKTGRPLPTLGELPDPAFGGAIIIEDSTPRKKAPKEH